MVQRVIAATIVAAGVASVAAVTLSGQAAKPAAPKPSTAKPATTAAAAPKGTAGKAGGTALRTPWGDPDLQGVWNSSNSTPLERPKDVAGKSELTDAEANAEFERQRAFEMNRDRRDGSAQADVRRAYNEHWMDERHNKVADNRTSLIYDPADGRIPPLVTLSPERQAARKLRAEQSKRFDAGNSIDVFDSDVDGRCIIRTDLVPYLPYAYNNNFQIFQAPGYVVLAPEMIHSARIVPLDGRAPLALPQWLGTTRGHWDGATLVLETTNFSHEFDGRVLDGASPKTFKVTERLTRVDGETMRYEFTIEDPQTWTRPWSAWVNWSKIDPAEQMYEYACHEDNFDLVHFLKSARAHDKNPGSPK